MCPVAAVELMHEMFPGRAPGGEEEGLPLFRFEDGSPLKRSAIRELLGAAAVALNMPRSRVGVHSLRVGGATALWVATRGNATLVRRLGRWKSDAVHRYLWDLPQLGGGTTAKMLDADTSVPWAEIRKELE